MGDKWLIDGWILNMVGIYEETDICPLPDYMASVPIKLIDQANKVEKNLMMITDWVSISKVDEKTYKPDLAICIYEIKQNELLKNKVWFNWK